MSAETDDLIRTLGLSKMRDGVDAMLSRERDFPSTMAAVLSGVAMNPEARRRMDYLADQKWGDSWIPPERPIPEVVVGSGPHALIYAAIRSAKGVPVVVLEKGPRAGGSFACSEKPTFWLNSRNRPGPLSLPGEGEGLNVLPGCTLQPSMVGSGEYQTNADLAWTIRANLMMLSGVEVHTGVRVKSINRRSDGTFLLDLRGTGGANQVIARRVVFATGLGDPRAFNSDDDKPDRVLTFAQFMAKMDGTFPLRDMGRVAVLGAGDSGKTVIEALLGQGPQAGMSVTALDFPTKIDWYGCNYLDQNEWCAANRGRYSRIGKALGGRITPRIVPGVYPTSGYQSVQIGPRIYDWVVNCTGYRESVKATGAFARRDCRVGDRLVARRFQVETEEDEVYAIGPAARIAIPQSDKDLSTELFRLPDNASSIFRYAPLTAAFADNLPFIKAKPEPVFRNGAAKLSGILAA